MSRKKESSYITEQRPFPTRLRELMKENGITQKALAEIIGVQPQTVSLYAIGQSLPNTDTLSAIASSFHVSADWLLGLSDVKSPDVDLQQACNYTGLSEEAVKRLSYSLHPDEMDKIFFDRLSSFISYMVEDEDLVFALAFLSGAIDEAKFLLVHPTQITDFSRFMAITDELRAQGHSAISIDYARNVYVELTINYFRKIVSRFVDLKASNQVTKEDADNAPEE